MLFSIDDTSHKMVEISLHNVQNPADVNLNFVNETEF
jgi:hypothetical protein